MEISRRSRLVACILLMFGQWSVFTFVHADSVSAQNAVYQAAILSPARTDEDRKLDARRKPLQFLQFAQIEPGMKVLEVFAGGGATSELVALAIGNTGMLWAQNEKASPALENRLAATPQPNLHPVARSFDDPVPDEARMLDLVIINMNYHDIVNTPANRAAMNRHLFEGLKPGGHLLVIDSAANPGKGLSETNTLHRIEEATVCEELSAAGFILEARSDYLGMPDDPRTEPFFKMGSPDDKFALRFLRK